MSQSVSFLQELPLIILVLALVAYWVMAYFLLYHMTRFGVGSRPKLASFVFLLGSLALTIVVIIIYVQIGNSGLTDSVQKFY